MRVLILGAGGHAQVVADILLRAHESGSSAEPLGYLDDNPALIGRSFIGLPVLDIIDHLSYIAHDAIVVAIGENATRRRLFNELRRQGERFVLALHPRAAVAPDVKIGAGTMICAGVVVNPGSLIGDDVILNTGCTIDHHNQIGDHVHVAPGVHLGGEVTVGDGALIGIGSTVMPRCRIGECSVVGAGACVTRSVPAHLTVVGVPAKLIQRP